MSRAGRAGHRVRATLSLFVAAAVLATAVATSPAAAAPFSFSYDWAGAPATGYLGWQRTDQLPTPGPDPPFAPPYYLSSRGSAGAGIRLQPSPAADGTRDRVFSNYDPTTQSGGPKINEIFTAPGTTTIARARVRGVEFLNDSEGQILRAAIINENGIFVPGSAYGLDEGSPPPGPFLPGVPYSNVALPELTWPPSASGTPSRLELSLRTICVPAGSCPLVRFRPDGSAFSSGRFGTVELDLVDHEVPTLSIGGSLTTTASWVNASRNGRLTVTGQDPGSGIRRLRLERRSGASTTVLLNETITCDPSHTSPPPGTLAGGTCPAGASRTVTQNVSQNGTTTFVATATDLSGEFVTGQTQVRIDRQGPTAKVGGSLRALQGRWTNRADGVPATLSGSDALSGVSRLQLASTGASSGTAAAVTVCGAGTGPSARCPTSASGQAAVDLGSLREGRTLLRPVAFDLAGNRSPTAPALTLLLDRRPPGVPRAVRLVRSTGGARLSFSRPSRDSGSPIGATEVRSSAGSGALGAWRTTGAASVRLSGRASQSLHAEVRSLDTAGNRSRAVRVDLPARASSATGRAVCRPGRRCTRAPQRKSSYGKTYARKIKAAAAKKKKGVQCPIYVRNAADRDLQQHAREFKARNVNKGVRIVLGDRLSDGTAVCGTKGVITVMQGVATLTQLATGRRLAGPRSISYLNIPGTSKDPLNGVGELRFDCRPSLDAWRSYLVSSPGFQGALTRPDGRQAPILPRREPTTIIVRLRCPNTYQRHEYEIDAWNDLAGYDPSTRFLSSVPSDRAKVSYARQLLRRKIIGELPGGPGQAWQAHHIIPLRDMTDNGHVVVPAAFRCKLYPNEVGNGVFLRARPYRKGTDRYEQIPERDRKITWHPLTQRPYLDDYFRAVRIALSRRAIDNSTGACRDSRSFTRVMGTIKSQLLRGGFVSDAPE